jgi:hypothetical protein
MATDTLSTETNVAAMPPATGGRSRTTAASGRAVSTAERPSADASRLTVCR